MWKVSCNLSVSQCVLQRCSTGITDLSARMLRICVDHMENWRSSTGLLTNSPMLIGLPMWVAVSRPGGISDVSLIELLQSSHTRSRESILKLRDMRQILVFLNNTSLTCATMHSQHRCTCVGNTLPRSGANHGTRRVQARGRVSSSGRIIRQNKNRHINNINTISLFCHSNNIMTTHRCYHLPCKCNNHNFLSLKHSSAPCVECPFLSQIVGLARLSIHIICAGRLQIHRLWALYKTWTCPQHVCVEYARSTAMQDTHPQLRGVVLLYGDA